MIGHPHLIDEANKRKKNVLAQASEQALVTDTLGGRMHVRWDETAQATPHGQIVFFAEFLATAGVFERWVQGCPLHYSSPNASSSAWLLAVVRHECIRMARRAMGKAVSLDEALEDPALAFEFLDLGMTQASAFT